MQPTKIEYVTHAWNPLRGCRIGCPYCWARKLAIRRGDKTFQPKFYPDRLGAPSKRKKPAIIFACDMGDIHSQGVHPGWRKVIYDTVKLSEQHQFLFLTKRPEGYNELLNESMPNNVWLGVTATRSEEIVRMRTLGALALDGKRTYLQLEPLLGPVAQALKLEERYTVKLPEWVIIGRASNYKHDWDPVWVDKAIAWARSKRIPVFVKDNVKWPEKIREFPPGIRELAGDLI